MNILWIQQHYGGPKGSGSLRAFEFITGLQKMGHQVTLLTGDFERMDKEDIEITRKTGVVVHVAPVKYSQKMGFYRRLIAFKRFIMWCNSFGKSLPKQDVVFASSTPLPVGDIGRFLSRHHKCPFIFEIRDLWPETTIESGHLKGKLFIGMANRMADRIYKSATHIITTCESNAVGVTEWNFPKDRITVIPHGTDLQRYEKYSDKDLKEIRTQMGWDEKFVLIHPGAMGFTNWLDYAVDMGKILDKKGIKDILIALVGGGALRDSIEKRIQSEKIKSVRVYDPVPSSEIPGLLKASNMGLMTVYPGKRGESPNKVTEYCSAGIPTLFNYESELSQDMKKHNVAFIAHQQDPETAVNILISIKEDRSLLEKVCSNARAYAEQHYDRRKHILELENIIQSLV